MESENGERVALPVFYFAVSSRKRRKTERVSGRRAPRERCVQLVFRSKPGGVMLPSEARFELTAQVYACEGEGASGENT